jgi:hypothetical protein
MIYGEAGRLEALTGSEYEALGAEARAYIDELKRSGHFVTAERLQRVDTATSVRIRDGKPMITDGPFVEAKEHLAGFVLIEARDLNEALQLAARIPPARLGGVEVRPIWQPEEIR